MNNNPLIQSIDSTQIITNDIEKSSKTHLQNLGDFLDQTLIKFNDSVCFNSVPDSAEIPSPLVQARINPNYCTFAIAQWSMAPQFTPNT
jgi:hypothetical protein